MSSSARAAAMVVSNMMSASEMGESDERQAGAVASRVEVDLRIPDGLMLADLQGAARFIELYGNEIANEAVWPSGWSPDDPDNAEMQCAAKVYEFLAAAAAKNLGNS
jgi:hypothetical protein